jgi:thiol:disulfide interchange protein
METAIVILLVLCMVVFAAAAWGLYRIFMVMMDGLTDELNRLEGALAQKGIQIW